MKREPHIKAYQKIRKLYNEISDAMVAYRDDGKFEAQADMASLLSSFGERGLLRHIELHNQLIRSPSKIKVVPNGFI